MRLIIRACTQSVMTRLKQLSYLTRFMRFGAICTVKKCENHPWMSVTFSKVAGLCHISFRVKHKIVQLSLSLTLNLSLPNALILDTLHYLMPFV